MAGAEETPNPASAGKVLKRRRLPRRGAARKCPYTLRSQAQGASIIGDGDGERQAANDAFNLLVNLKFQFEGTLEAEKGIIQHMGEMHCKYRGALKKIFFSGKSFEEAIANVPFGVDPADWQVMCKKWSTSAEQSVANRNKANRAHQTMPYRLGRWNIYQLEEEFRKTQGRDPDCLEIFRLTRSKDLPDGNQVWVDDESRVKIDQMTQLMGQPSESSGDILTFEQAFIQVMGKDGPSRVRCAGRVVTL